MVLQPLSLTTFDLVDKIMSLIGNSRLSMFDSGQFHVSREWTECSSILNVLKFTCIKFWYRSVFIQFLERSNRNGLVIVVR